MTRKELQSIDNLKEIVLKIKEQNKLFMNNTSGLIEKMNKKVNEKHEPIVLEKNFNNVLTTSISEAIKTVLVDNYSSPLKGIIKNIVEKKSGVIAEMV